MKTHFSLEKCYIADSDNRLEKHIWFDGNSKVTASSGTFKESKPNSFSTIQIQDCPYCTKTCVSECYVHGLEKAKPDVHAAFIHNSSILREFLNKGLRIKLSEQFARWITFKNLREFRWHNSGDLISKKHAEFIRDVCLGTPDVLHWIYTRSFPYVFPLLEAPNLVVNLSADKDNWSEAKRMHIRTGARLCYLTVEGEVPIDLPAGSVIFPSYPLRGRGLKNPTDSLWWKSLPLSQKKMVCPPDFFGQSEKHRCGPCNKCMF